MKRMESMKPMSDAEAKAAVRAEFPWLLERRQACERAAAKDAVSGAVSEPLAHPSRNSRRRA